MFHSIITVTVNIDTKCSYCIPDVTLYLECLETFASKLAGIIFPMPNNRFWKLLVYSNPGVDARLVSYK